MIQPPKPGQKPKPGQPPAPVITPLMVAQMARSQITLDLPKIGSAPCTRADCMGAVGVPVWLWVQGGFPTRAATASVGAISVTVAARMSSVDWSMGDGSTVHCSTPGTAYNEAIGFAASPDCGYAYQKVSRDQPGGTWPITATAHWDVAFTGAYQQTLTIDTQSTVRAHIGEYQALVVS